MADNATLPAAGLVVATEEIGGVHYQLVKITHGPADSATPVSAATPMPTTAATTDAKLDTLITAIGSLLAELQLKPDASEQVLVAQQDISLLERVALKALARLTFSTTGARVDCGGSAVTASIAASQTLGTVTTVGTVGALGRLTQDGVSIQMTQLNYTNGFRARLV